MLFLPNRASRPIPPDLELAIVVIQGQRYWIAALISADFGSGPARGITSFRGIAVHPQMSATVQGAMS